MSDLDLKICFGVLWTAYILIRAPHDRNYKKIDKKRVIDNSREKVLVFLQLIGMGILPWLWVLSPWLNQFGIGLPLVLRYAGVFIAISSLYYFWTIHKTLGINWSPVLEIRSGHRLIKSGVYRRIRHPMYAQIWAWAVAQLLITSNWIVGITGIFLWSVLYFVRVQKEEEMMLAEFGEEYEVYMRQTGRVLPKFWDWKRVGNKK